MGWGVPPKHINAKKIAAAISYISLSGLDKIGVAAFNDSVIRINPPARGKRRYSEIIDFLRVLEPDGRTHINACMGEYASSCKNSGIIVILSDLLDGKGLQDGLMSLTSRNFDIHLVQILDHEEIFWSKTGNLLLTELETGETKQIFMDRSLLGLYRKKVSTFISGIKGFCRNYGIGFYLHDTGIPFEDFLIEYLTRGTIFR